MIFLTVFVLTFMSADYMITGSVTNTWIAIAVLVGLIAAGIRKIIEIAVGSLSIDEEAKQRVEQRT